MRWSPRALDQIDALADYIAKSSGAYPTVVVRRIFDRTQSLPDQPGQGRRVSEYEGSLEIREVFVHRWRVMHLVSEAEALVVAVIHGARTVGPTDFEEQEEGR